MKGVAVLPFAAALAIALAGCGAGRPSRLAATVTITVSPQPHRRRVQRPSSASATTNERLFADGEAASIPLTLALVVAGTLMRAYARFQHAYGAAWGAIGQPFSSENVTRMAGGFKLCSAGTGSGSGCSAFTQFTADDAGRITGVSVNGRAVAGRIATAPDATSGGLTISGVVAYRLTGQNVVVVAFRLTDSSYRPVNTEPVAACQPERCLRCREPGRAACQARIATVRSVRLCRWRLSGHSAGTGGRCRWRLSGHSAGTGGDTTGGTSAAGGSRALTLVQRAGRNW